MASVEGRWTGTPQNMYNSQSLCSLLKIPSIQICTDLIQPKGLYEVVAECSESFGQLAQIPLPVQSDQVKPGLTSLSRLHWTLQFP